MSFTNKRNSWSNSSIWSWSWTVLAVVNLIGLIAEIESTEDNSISDGWKWWGANNETDFGQLCETDNDKIGVKLGCNCSNITQGGSVTADCSDKWLGYNDTLVLPPRINISRHVRNLDFSKNHLTHLTEDTFGDCEGVFEMSFYKNKIHTVHGLHCSRLKKLDLSWNNIKNLSTDAFKNLPRLQDLDVSSNDLIFLDPNVFEQLTLLKTVNLASNPLGFELFYFEDFVLSLSHLEYLEDLNLSNTSLSRFPLSLINGTKNLKKLRLNSNLISELEAGVLHNLPYLEELDLSGNLFITLTPRGFNGLSSLKRLFLDKMRQLKSIEKYAFAGLISLDELSCQKNHFLTSIDAQAFQADPDFDVNGESKPRIVRLGDNNLNFIEFPLLSWKDMEELELYRNPWVCDCNLQWVAEYSTKKIQDAAVLIDSDFKCYTPPPVAGRPVAAVEPELMLCYSPAATVAGTIGIIIFCTLLMIFCIIVGLSQFGILPDWLKKYNIFGSSNSLPKYSRVNPKPSRHRRMEKMGLQNNDRKGDEPSPDLEWDSGDIGTYR